jgi:hypothetical protein
MTNTITIPPEALRAARAASMNALGDGEDAVKAACLAMLRSWPGTVANEPNDGLMLLRPGIFLPLPKEPSNDK